eukprot:gene16937-18644_t
MILLLIAFVLITIQVASASTIKLGVCIPWSGSNWDAGPRFASGILIALDRVNRDPALLPGHNLTFEWKDSKCEESASLTSAVDMYTNSKPNIHAIIGPACSDGCKAVGYLANHWNIPIVSYGCGSEQLSDKELFPTFVRTVGVYSKSGDIFVRLMNLYKWDRIAILTPTSAIWTSITNGVRREVEKNGLKVGYYHNFNPATVTNEEITASLKVAKTKSHVFVLGGYSGTIRMIMLAAYKLGLVEVGYTFITYELLLDSCNDTESTREENEMVCKAYEGILDISLYVPSTKEYKNFTAEVRRRMADPPFNRTMLPSEQVEIYAAFLHDAVLLYALALNKTLNQGKSANDGKAVVENMLNASFTGKSGKVVIDSVGDRSSALQLQNVQNGQYMRVMNYYTNEGRLVMINETVIVWPGKTTTAPLGRPRCGFDNELCPVIPLKDVTWIYGLGVGIPVTLLIFFAMCCSVNYRRRKFEEKLLSQQWRINLSEIQLRDNHARGRLSSLNSSCDMGSRFSMGNSTNSDYRAQIFTRIGRFKNKYVALKTVFKTHIELSREVLLELKNAIEANHQNLNSFIGACIEPSTIFLVSAYCNKGSLHDVLLNDSLKLDWMFQISIASDVARGMQYLHNSSIKYHGSLKSSNVVIDSRWVCKIADFGLRKFKSGQQLDPERSNDYIFSQMLWTAPENLSANSNAFTPMSDVYSYGIILQEILLRDVPYGMFANMPSKEIVKRVSRHEDPPFRPLVTSDIGRQLYQDLMKMCWNEDPAERPRFHDIMNCLKKINGGKNANVVDNMITMMEKYTDHLEDLVAERTNQLEEEKIKTDQLLYSMLPRSVADVLKRGERVTAESFDMVTIFFSDIVIDLLNDLYTLFDKIVESYDVYKVETIGDAYMVVSGLPTRIGKRHAGEIAKLSLDLLSAMTTFKIRHKPDYQLQLRIGIHSGPCVAGVVGLKMPRYCLFGDTVNYASRMESSGLSLRIHVSPECRDVLFQLGGYNLTKRGMVEMKGKGTIMTYWLTGYYGFNKPLPDLAKAADISEHVFK